MTISNPTRALAVLHRPDGSKLFLNDRELVLIAIGLHSTDSSHNAIAFCAAGDLLDASLVHYLRAEFLLKLMCTLPA